MADKSRTDAGGQLYTRPFKVREEGLGDFELCGRQRVAGKFMRDGCNERLDGG